MNEDKPARMVKMTLSMAVQNKVLPAMFVLGISESYPQKHEIIVHPNIFAEFMCQVAQLEEQPTIKQLNLEWIDLKQEPIRTLRKYRS